MLFVNRKEEKFFVDPVRRAGLERAARAFMTPDPHSAGGAYRVRSLYFDAFDNRDFYAKLGGEEKKKKLRLRGYGAGAALKLECKEKTGEAQRKTSLLVREQEARALMAAEYGWLLERPEPEAARFYLLLSLGAYRPAAMVEYDRAAYTYPEFDTRVTLDGNIRYSESNLDFFDPNIQYDYVPFGGCVLEVKYNERLVGFLRRMLAGRGLIRVSYSKYQWSRALLNT